jgi:hypothetical protein
MPFRWKRVLLPVLPLVAITLLPYLHRLLNPDFYASVRCVQQEAKGEVVKASGDACDRGDVPTVRLRLGNPISEQVLQKGQEL